MGSIELIADVIADAKTKLLESRAALLANSNLVECVLRFEIPSDPNMNNVRSLRRLRRAFENFSSARRFFTQPPDVSPFEGMCRILGLEATAVREELGDGLYLPWNGHRLREALDHCRVKGGL